MATVAGAQGFDGVSRKPARRFGHFGVPRQWRNPGLPALQVDEIEDLQFVAEENGILLCMSGVRA